MTDDHRHGRGPALVGILGAGGAVGGAVARAVSAAGLARLRLGTRTPGAALQLRQRLGNGAEAAPVDISEQSSVARFCAGCRVVVNCAASTGRQRETAALAVLASGADYVDPGGDEALRARLGALPELADRIAVLNAGVQPGLSELLPRWLAAQGLGSPLVLTSYVGTRDRMTPASATEFLLSLTGEHGEAHAMWRVGARHSRALEPLHQADLPFFPEGMLAYPYLSTEAERMARRLNLDEARCYYVFEPDGKILSVLSQLQERVRGTEHITELAGELTRAAEIEMFGRKPGQQLVIRLDGEQAGRRVSKVAVLRTSSTYELTATVVTLVVGEILARVLPEGAHFAAEILDPGVVGRLAGLPGVVGMHLLDEPLPPRAAADQGVV